MRESNTIMGTLISIKNDGIYINNSSTPVVVSLDDNHVFINNSSTPIVVSLNEFLKPISRAFILSAGSIKKVIKNSPGWIIATNSGILYDVKILDGDTEVWADEDYNSPQPFYCETSINMKSNTGGLVNVVFL